jgi:hypothetical protein
MADEQFVVMDVPAPAQGSALAANHSGQWGLASLLLGCFLILVFPIAAVGCGAGAALGALARSVDEHALRGWVSVVKLAVYCLIGAAALALVFGFLGLWSAWSRRQPAGLAVAGSSVAVLALVLHLLLLVIYDRLAEDMMRERPYWHNGPRPVQPRGQFG